MTDLSRGFLADIIAHPDDDTPRLIYADWLEENGQEERAELIRGMVANPDGDWVITSTTTPSEVVERIQRVANLPQRVTVILSRGFVSQVWCKAEVWQAHGPALAAEHPLERVELTDFQPTQVSTQWGIGTPAPYYSWEPSYLVENAPPVYGRWLAHVNCLWHDRKRYATAEAALDAMSAVLITWARREGQKHKEEHP